MDVLAQLTGGGGGSAQWVFLLGLCVMIVVLLVRSRRYFRQVARHQNAMPPPNRITATTKPVSIVSSTKQHEQWEVAMHELARDLSGQLDSKIRVLEMLIREANQTAARLDSALDKARQTRSSERDHKPEEQPAPRKSEPRNTAGRAAEPRKLEPKQPAPWKPSSAASLHEWSEASGALDAKPTPPNPRFERIYALADAGLSPTTIANQIGSQLGEVELILSLRGTQTAE